MLVCQILLPRSIILWCTALLMKGNDMYRKLGHSLHILFYKWYTSLDLFEPKELSLIALVTLNTLVRSSSLLLRYFSWWFFVWAGYIDLYIDGFGLFSRLWEYATPLYYSIGFEPRLYLVTLMLGVFLMVMSVRSSIEAKTFSYFFSSPKKLCAFAVMFFALPHMYTMPFFWLSSFFLFDSPAGLRAMVMSAYNGIVLNLAYAPFLLCVGAAHGILFDLHRLLWDLTALEEYHFAPYAAKYTTSALLYLFFIATIHTFYVRVVQANSSNPLFWRRYKVPTPSK